MGVKSRNMLIGIAMALYVVSLTLPTVAPFSDNVSTESGWWAFQYGWHALVSFVPREVDWWVFAGAWVVNPLVWVAAVSILTGRRRTAAFAAWAGVVLCMPVLIRFYGIIVGHTGYWCWLASAALLALGSCVPWATSGETDVKTQ